MSRFLLPIVLFSTALADPAIELTANPDILRVTWTNGGKLQKSSSLRLWTTINAANSPHEIDISKGGHGFYRVIPVADTVIQNAKIHTVDDALPMATALAIKDGEIIYIGNESAAPYIGAGTDVIEVGGRLVIPGFQDAHLHAIEAGITESLSVLPQFGSEAEYRAALQQTLNEQPGSATDWVVGAGVNMAALLESVSSPLAVIDEVISTRPAVILDDLGHGAWANSLALATVGFDQLAQNPPGGIIDVDDEGELTGVVFESASQNLVDASQPPTEENLDFAYQSFINAALPNFARNGITTVSDAGGYWPRGHQDVWARAESENMLTVRANNAFYVYPEKNVDQQIADIIALRKNDPNHRHPIGK